MKTDEGTFFPNFPFYSALASLFWLSLVIAPGPAVAIEDPSLEFKIGQMLMIGFRGLEVEADHPILVDIRERHIGGVILFDYDVPNRSPVRNIAAPPQVKKLTADLQATAEIPLLIAVDQEGGRVNRLKEDFGFPSTSSAASLGRGAPAETGEAAKKMAHTLASLGINFNLAPVVDLAVNPDNPIIAGLERSFGTDPETVAHHAGQFIKAHREMGIFCSLKHFPGHGSSKADSHLGVADVTATWSPVELEPFAHLIRRGKADAIMTAHVFHIGLDSHYPATLSHDIITGMLRQQLGFNGLVVSDDMQMKAIAGHFGWETAVLKAILAGVDILVFANNSVFEEDIAARTTVLIRRLVEEGKISEERIDASYRRIMLLKERLFQVKFFDTVLHGPAAHPKNY
jgi:beta-N-acetylhexosaminidase